MHTRSHAGEHPHTHAHTQTHTHTHTHTHTNTHTHTHTHTQRRRNAFEHLTRIFFQRFNQLQVTKVVIGLKEVRCSFYQFSKPIRFCSNLVKTFFNPFPIRKRKKNWGSPCWFSRWRWSKFPWLHAHFRSGFFLLSLLVGSQWTSECAQTSGQTLSLWQKWFWELFCSRHCFTGKNSQYHIWLSGA